MGAVVGRRAVSREPTPDETAGSFGALVGRCAVLTNIWSCDAPDILGAIVEYSVGRRAVARDPWPGGETPGVVVGRLAVSRLLKSVSAKLLPAAARTCAQCIKSTTARRIIAFSGDPKWDARMWL